MESKFEKLKKANPDKFVEFSFGGETWWVKNPTAKPSVAQSKAVEFNLTDKKEGELKTAEAIPFIKWNYMASLYEQPEPGVYVRCYEDSECDQAYDIVSNEFIAALDKVMIGLRTDKDEPSKN